MDAKRSVQSLSGTDPRDGDRAAEVDGYQDPANPRGCTHMHAIPEDAEKSLVKRCLAGERDAWDTLFEAHFPTISSIAAWKKWGFDRADIEDVRQDILEAVIRSLKTFEFRSRLSTFIYRISVSSCIAHLRRKTATKRGGGGAITLSMECGEERAGNNAIFDGLSITKNPEKLLIDQEGLRAMRGALARLDERCRELIRFRYYEELSFSEIAAMTGTKENTLVVMLRRCLLRLLDSVKAAG
ncbi:MAG: sigma-70 family RNA polymerase sigma factor [Desulfomonile tiedjei]|nr:sigma-70 family RNA polymerase sigma factor [Desulfomonile tiedjei]